MTHMSLISIEKDQDLDFIHPFLFPRKIQKNQKPFIELFSSELDGT